MKNTTYCSRRALLAAGGLASVGSISGCLATLPPLGRRVRYGRVDSPKPNPADYRKWVPPLAAFPGGEAAQTTDTDRYIMYTTPGNMGAKVIGQSMTFPRTLLTGRLDYFGIGYDNFTAVIQIGAAIVCKANFDPETVGNTVTASGYTEGTSYNGYDVYTRTDIPRTLAVGDSTLVFAKEKQSRETVTAVLDARAGRIDRRHETSDHFDTITSAAGTRPFTWIGPISVDTGSEVAGAQSFTFDAQAVYYIYDLVYPQGTTAPEQTIKDELNAKTRARNASLTDVQIDGRVARVEIRQTHEAFMTNTSDPNVPQITWGVEYDKNSSTVTLRHEAGETVKADRLSLAPLSQGDKKRSVFSQEQIEPGDSVTVDVASLEGDAALRLFYTERNGPLRTALLEYHIEDS